MHGWQQDIIDAIRAAEGRQVAYEATVLTTEEEGIPLLAGAWLGGQRGVLLMQSSGVGNCVNMLSLAANGGFPLPMLITMRGEWAEFNGWQVPMSQGTRPALAAMGVVVQRAERAEEVGEIVTGALELAYASERAVAVLLAQRLIGRKRW
ncbi:MAG: phosphonopyruvate decarboxylase [Deinococcus-Thermus bacterium]|jgi:sulfopyruvate decarboxylase TPP-binding subunit|nr:phosphonopyruvate decarboxylase [Deinococcota bacterium]